MSPRIRFFPTADGGRIAYAVDGNGPCVVFPAWWVSHLDRDFENAAFRAFFLRLAERATVVRYDRPGVGLSERGRAPYSLESEVAHLERLVEELGEPKIALVGGSCGGPPAVAYAARHPDRLTHLVLYNAYACGPKLAPDDLKAAVTALVRAHWGLGSKTLTEMFAPDHSPAERDELASMQRAASSPETAAELLQLIYAMDVSDCVASVSVPTLVLHRVGDRAISFENGRALAARIAGATFEPLAGSAHMPWMGDWASVADAILGFVAPTRSGSSRPPHDRDGDVENELVREGDVWHVAFDGQRRHVKHARGLADIAMLLANPGVDIAAVRLMDGESRADFGADPVLDARARAELRERVHMLDETIASAEAAGDVEAATRATRERAAIVAEVRAATGLRGKSRTIAGPAERARKAVTGRIRDAIERLRGVSAELGRHLDASITTGSTCRYSPPTPTHWRT